MAIDFLPIFSKTDSSVAGQSAIRAAKSARVGTRLARLVRVLRIIRVIKLFISAKRKKKGAEEEEEKVEDEGAPSELSKALQGTLAKRTIVFVLVLLAGQVLLEFPPYTQVKEPPVDDRIKVGLAQVRAPWRLASLTRAPVLGMPPFPLPLPAHPPSAALIDPGCASPPTPRRLRSSTKR